MSVIGLLLTLLAAVAYSLRYSFIKDLGKHEVSNLSVNFWYRVFGLPLIVIYLFISHTSILFSPQFWFWFGVSLLINFGFNLYQVHAFQKHPFSSVESLSFLGIFFTTIFGFFFFGETLGSREIIGIVTISIAFILLAITEYKKENNQALLQIALYYLFVAFIDIVNKQTILVSSPALYVFALTVGTIISSLLIAIIGKQKIYGLGNPKANRLLGYVGLFFAISFIAISYGYKLLPVGLVATIVSLKVFISLWLSKKKYQEDNLLPKYIASAIAVIGILILALR